MFTVGLVVGHSHNSQGAMNVTYNISEFEFNNLLVDKVLDYLSSSSIKSTKYLRTHGLTELVSRINKDKLDLVISFHCNACNTKVSGTETLYYHSSIKGKQIASELQQSIVSTLHLRDRGLKPVTLKDRGGYLLGKVQPTAVLLEPFFIDNNEDYSLANSNIDNLANSIAKTLLSTNVVG